MSGRRDWQPSSTSAAYQGLSSYASRSRLAPIPPPEYALPPPSAPLPILGSAWSSSTPAPRGQSTPPAPFPTGSPELEHTYGRPPAPLTPLERSYSSSRSAFQHPASMVTHGFSYAPAPAIDSYATEAPSYSPYGTVTSRPSYARPPDPYGASSSYSRDADPSPPEQPSYRREPTPALSYSSAQTPSYSSGQTPAYTPGSLRSPDVYSAYGGRGGDPTLGGPAPYEADDDPRGASWRDRYGYRASSYAYEDE